MKFITASYNNERFVGILSNCNKFAYKLNDFGLKFKDMNDLIQNSSCEDIEAIDKINLNSDINRFDLNKLKILSPIINPCQDIICLGINYEAHAKESAKFKKEAFGDKRKLPVYFSKRVSEAVGTDGEIDGHFDIVDSLDYEVELAVIIGKDCKNIKRDEVYEYIFGYTIINDFSARNIQLDYKQWYFGKSFDSFTSMGPCIVTKDEIDYPPKIDIRSYVNEEIRQNSNTSNMIFDIGYAISDLSRGMTLKKGTIISMGTPEGVGMGFDPPKFLVSGDLIRCEIQGIGILKNTVI